MLHPTLDYYSNADIERIDLLHRIANEELGIMDDRDLELLAELLHEGFIAIADNGEYTVALDKVESRYYLIF